MHYFVIFNCSYLQNVKICNYAVSNQANKSLIVAIQMPQTSPPPPNYRLGSWMERTIV